jgi:ABC-type multidrug transport system ATPase subunit
MIVVDRLTKRYRGGAEGFVLRDLSFEVGRGEALALLGRNGAGKSTTVGVLATLLSADAGTALIGGRDIGTEPGAVRELLGVALQESGLPRKQTARRLLRHHARLLGRGEREAAALSGETLAAFGLEAAGDRALGSCSGGERRRLHLALALLGRPPVILLDEPTVGLDPPARELFWRALRDQVEGGATVLFTTHDLREAELRAQRVAIIDEGALSVDARPDELKRAFGPLALTLAFGEASEARRALALVGHGELIDELEAVISMSEAEEMQRVLRLLEAEGIGALSATLAEPTLEAIFRRLTSAGDHVNTTV